MDDHRVDFGAIVAYYHDGRPILRSIGATAAHSPLLHPSSSSSSSSARLVSLIVPLRCMCNLTQAFYSRLINTTRVQPVCNGLLPIN
jgi:hypothetical protein